MRNKEYYFELINKGTGKLESDFLGTELEFARLFSDKDWLYDFGYPSDLISDFKQKIEELETSDDGWRNYNDEKIAVYEKAIRSLRLFIDKNGVDSPAIITNFDDLKAVDILSISDSTIIKKKEIINEIKDESKINNIVDGYISGSTPRRELLTAAKSLSDSELIGLEDKLKDKGIDLNKFQNDLKSSAPKFKP
ncbi:hypothetical protein [Pseudomonas tohonis]|uniref:hypothetical protein n=1 Tax=Pseudomonas tohonis TaxID=2725477 RepID=UPI001F2912D1|nr:hypothetical protein [Pseudomonas tohonis]